MPVITVIVPVYKVEPYLHRCVDSILRQTFSDFELILVDDGSPDGCPAMCDEYAARDSRVHVIHQKSGGLSAARNAGTDWAFANSDSQWIAFIDSDDWVHPQYLEALYQAVKENHVKISFCQFIKTDVGGTNDSNRKMTSQKIKMTEHQMERLFYGKEPYGSFAWGKLVYKDVLRQAGAFELGRIYENSAQICKWFYAAGEAAEVPLPLYYYFINEDGIIRSKFSLKQLDILWSKEEQERFYCSLGYQHMRSVVVSSYLVSAARCYRQTYSELGNKAAAKQIKKKLWKKYYQNRSIVVLTREERNYIGQMLFPHLMELYWFVLAIKNKVIKIVSDDK